VSEIALLREQLADRDDTIRDLRTRLDASEGERRTIQAQLTALSQKPEMEPGVDPPRTAWRRFIAWRRWPA